MSAQPQSPYGGPMPGDQQQPQPNPVNYTPGSLPAPAQPAIPTGAPTGGNPVPGVPATPTVNPYGEAPKANGDIDSSLPAAPASPYDFFMGNGQAGPAKKGLASALPNSPGKQIAFIAGGGLLIVLILGGLTLFAPKSSPKDSLLKVNQTQIETLRLCTAGQNKIEDKALRGFAVNCNLVMTTESQQLTAYLKKAHVKIKGKILQQGYNKKSDTTLAAASSSSNYDDAFKTVALGQLTTQGRSLQTAIKDPDSTTSEKKQMTSDLNATKLLIKQLQGDQSSRATTSASDSLDSEE